MSAGTQPEPEDRALFTVLTRGRTGSTPFVEDLDAHPDIACYQELFRLGPEEDLHDKVRSYASLARERGPISASEYLEIIAPKDCRAFGWKTLVAHFDEREDLHLWNLLTTRHAKIIYMVRNPAAAALSAAIAIQRGIFNIPKVSLEYCLKLDNRNQPLQLDIDWLVEEAGYYRMYFDMWHNKLKQSQLPVLVVEYERYLHNKGEVLNSAYAFLGVPTIKVPDDNPYEIMVTSSVLERVANLEEALRALRKAGFDPGWERTSASAA